MQTSHAIGSVSLVAAFRAPSAFVSQPVTTSDFKRGKTDWLMAIQAKTGCFARLCVKPVSAR